MGATDVTDVTKGTPCPAAPRSSRRVWVRTLEGPYRDPRGSFTLQCMQACQSGHAGAGASAVQGHGLPGRCDGVGRRTKMLT